MIVAERLPPHPGMQGAYRGRYAPCGGAATRDNASPMAAR